MDVSDWIARHAAATPDKAALRFRGRELSYGELAALVDRQASALAASGVAEGQCVAYLGFNSPEMIALLFACARLGALYMPLNWRLAAPEHRHMLRDCPPALMFVEAPFVTQTQTILDAVPQTTPVAFDAPPAGWLAYDEFLHRAGNTPATNTRWTDKTPLLICYTSGSTGAPKGVLLTQGALFWNAVNSMHMHDLSSRDHILTTLPLFHVGGLNIQTTPALHAGCTVTLHAKFDVDAAFDAIEHEGVTLTVLVPAQIDMMLASPRWAQADFSSLRMISTGSTIIPPRITEAVHAKGVPFVQVYGSTETCPIATYLTAKDALPKAGSAGKAASHCAVRIVDDAGRKTEVGVTGEIQVLGPSVMAGYWNKPEETAAALRDGWFHTGDMGHWDSEGYLWVDGRKKDMIISGGENIYPAEIENVLAECPDIEEVSVVGRADARWGEIVVAVVVPKRRGALTEEAVLRLCEGRIARFKHPKEVVFVAQLPRTALGKVRKEAVRDIVQPERMA